MKKVSQADTPPSPGLRERKKAKTRAAIQQHALRLFQEQGYDATTIEQIAEAAEISPSTFFRYFPTKEDVALYDEFDPPVFAAFIAQPAEANPVQALRGALRAVYSALPDEEMARLRARMQLILAVPELRMRTLDQFAEGLHLMADLIARRTGQRADEMAVRVLAGAIIGAIMSVLLVSEENEPADLLALMDDSLASLEAMMSS
jgi:AcrR family transcriptional regulator